MDKPLIMVSSFTGAMRGQEILKTRGISAVVLRTFSKEAGGGCGYSIYVRTGADEAEKILKESGLRVLGRLSMEGERYDIP